MGRSRGKDFFLIILYDELKQLEEQKTHKLSLCIKHYTLLKGVTSDKLQQNERLACGWCFSTPEQV